MVNLHKEEVKLLKAITKTLNVNTDTNRNRKEYDIAEKLCALGYLSLKDSIVLRFADGIVRTSNYELTDKGKKVQE